MEGGRILILGFGNPARGDDGLGPALALAIERAALPNVDVSWDYQPRVEFAADIAECDIVIFVDASATGRSPYSFRTLLPRVADSFSTHVLNPEVVLAMARDTFGWAGRAYLLGIRGYAFDAFEERLTNQAELNLAAAVEHLTAGAVGARLDNLLTDPPTDNTLGGGEPCKTANT